MHVQRMAASLAAVALTFGGVPAWAQEAAAGSPAAAPSPSVHLADSASPFGVLSITNADAAAVEMPSLAFAADPEAAANFDKYYAFHRADTDFATAYADIVECDGYARGLQSGIAYREAPYPYTYTLAGAIGGAIGNALADAIYGSAARRKLRRVNMRTCMHYKGYDRFGLPKSVWETFNFEEGLKGVPAAERERYLKQQALVASSGALQGEALGL